MFRFIRQVCRLYNGNQCGLFIFIWILFLFVYSWEEVEKEVGVQLVYKIGGVNWVKKVEMGYLIDKYVVVMDVNNIWYKIFLNNY